jgi:hypothetical protein
MDMKVTLPYDTEWKALHWAKKHCPSYITNEAELVIGGGIVYYFSDPRDITLFMLRWA